MNNNKNNRKSKKISFLDKILIVTGTGFLLWALIPIAINGLHKKKNNKKDDEMDSETTIFEKSEIKKNIQNFPVPQKIF